MIFIVAAFGKGLDAVRFGRLIETIFWSLSLPESIYIHYLAHTLAVLVILLELLLGILILTGLTTLSVKITTYLFILSLLIVNIWQTKNGRFDDCGCFGILLHRTPLMALIENLFIILLLFAGLRSSVKPAKLTLRLIILAFSVSICLFVISNTVWSPPGSALRSGSSWQYLKSIATDSTDSVRLFWFFNPECRSCIDQLDKYIGPFIDKQNPNLTAVTNATAGRIEEFRIDFDPQFPVIRVTREEWDTYAVPIGSLLAVQNFTVIRLWRSFEIPLISNFTYK